MPRIKHQDNQDQIAALKKQLKTCQDEIAALQSRHAQEIEKAAEIGYELGLLEAEEREARCAEAVANAIVEFEKRHAKNAPRTPILKRAGAKMNAALASKSTKKPSEAGKRSSKAAAQTEESVTKTLQSSGPVEALVGVIRREKI